MIITRMLGLSAAAAAFGVLAIAAPVVAQEKKAEPTKKVEPAKKAAAPACNSVKAQAGCEARSDCNWVGEAKDTKGKVTKRAYCRSNPTPKKDAKKG